VPGGERGIAVEVARVRGEVDGVRELRRVHEQARDDECALGAGGSEQSAVTRMERPHRRHEPDVGRTLQCRTGGCDRTDGFHSAIATVAFARQS
jgi:hypothetical protein